MGKIEFNYYQTIAQAKKLDELANELRSMLRGSYTSAANNISSAWKGNNADRYLDKLMDLKSEIESTARYLSNLASSIRKAAKIIYDAEKRAEELARRRNYGGGGSGGGGGGGH